MPSPTSPRNAVKQLCWAAAWWLRAANEAGGAWSKTLGVKPSAERKVWFPLLARPAARTERPKTTGMKFKQKSAPACRLHAKKKSTCQQGVLPGALPLPPGTFDPLCIPCSSPRLAQHHLGAVRGETEADWRQGGREGCRFSPTSSLHPGSSRQSCPCSFGTA